MDTSENVSDEDYLVRRAKQALEEGRVWEAKTWMLTARSIFPNNFSIQFEAYQSEKSRGNVKECAKCLQVLFDKFPNQQDLIVEINCLMDVLRRKKPEDDTSEGSDSFYIDMFDNMTVDIQKKMILYATDQAKSSDPLEHIKFMLVFIKRFEDEVKVYGEQLIETVNKAETAAMGSSGDPLNPYRTMLVTEILPTVLNQDKVKINSKLLLSNLFRAQEYVLGCALVKGSKNDQCNGSWSLLFNIVHNVARLLGWPAVPHVSPDAGSVPVDQYLAIMSTSPTPMFQAE